MIIQDSFIKVTYKKHSGIYVNSYSLGVSLILFEIKYDLTPDFSK